MFSLPAQLLFQESIGDYPHSTVFSNQAAMQQPIIRRLALPTCVLLAAMLVSCTAASASTAGDAAPPARQMSARSAERTPYWRERVSLFNTITHRAEVVMIGDSLTDGAEWHELFPRHNIANRGIDSDTTDGVLARLGDILAAKPQLAFVMIGINDFADAHRSVAAVWANYQQIVKRLESSGIKVVVVSTLPCHTVKGAWKSCGSYNSKIRVLNTRLARLSGSRVTFLDLWPVLVAGGNLRAEFTFDGIHLNGNGYQQWKKAMAPFMPAIAALPAR